MITSPNNENCAIIYSSSSHSVTVTPFKNILATTFLNIMKANKDWDCNTFGRLQTPYKYYKSGSNLFKVFKSNMSVELIKI